MLNFKIIGAGAAGNKAAIELTKRGYNLNDVILINSTSKDIPSEFKDLSIIFGSNSDSLGGCGKERSVGKRLLLQDMKSGAIDLNSIIDPDTNAVIIVSSTEGGSGSAATPVIAKYINEVIGIPVILVLFFGFNTDVRRMQNSIEVAQELGRDYGVIGISNAKYLEETNGNTIKAEDLANQKFADIVEILSGKNINNGRQNIDNTDLFKLIATPGYMMVETVNISKIKNIDQYNKIIASIIDNSKLIDCSDKGAKRLGVIYNISDDVSDYIDYNMNIIKSYYGIPYEIFTHIQDSNNLSVTWISAGLPLPVKEIQEIYENYLNASNSVNKNKDTFFDNVLDMMGNEEDGMFNMLSPSKPINKDKSDFFADFGFEEKESKKKSKTSKIENIKNEY